VDSREPIELPVERLPNSEEPDFARAFEVRFGGPPHEPPPAFGRPRPRVFLPLLLFVATWLSTFLVGGEAFGLKQIDAEVFVDWPAFVAGGLKYSTALMAILLAHEMGHFLQARRYGVPASLPWFIPIPALPLGTMGAVIVQASGFANRKQLFDIGISGPLAGLVLALPITIIGLRDSKVIDIVADGGGMTFGNPLILQWLAEWRFGPLAPGQDVALTPLLHAGWVGIFVTALNLTPIGQLDGGHILYCLIGRKAHAVARALLWFAIGYMLFTRNWSYAFMVILLMLMGARHPPSQDDSVPLGRLRTALGWLTLSFIVIGFTPEPFSLNDRPPAKQAPKPDPQAPSLFVRGESAPEPRAILLGRRDR
jgi:membrane-associated protease RseP (regulator of RpoE activity)